MSNLFENLTITKAQDLLSSGELTSEALIKHCIEIAQTKDLDIHTYREVFSDGVDEAKKADILRAEITKDHGGDTRAWISVKPLLGIPVSMKDNILIRGKIAGASSKILENYVATYDSTVTTRLREAGAIFIGRTNMDEFAMGGSTENSAYGPTKNPFDNTRVAGGSSGGATASVATGSALVGLGSDTGGSIRQPGAYCGVVGLKPTYGSVSRHGLMAMGSSLDVISPATKTVEDAELVFNIIKGKDVYDATSHDNPRPQYETLPYQHIDRSGSSGATDESSPLQGLVIGIVPKLMETGVDPIVLNNFNESVDRFKKLGATIKEIDLPNISYSLATYYIIMPAEVSSNMGRYDGLRFGTQEKGDTLIEDYMRTRGHLLGKEVRRRIMLGAYVLSAGYYDAYYNKANSVRRLISNDFRQAFKEVHIIAMPTAPSQAFKIGENSNDPVKMYLEDVFTVPANLVGIPALSVPTGMSLARSDENQADIPALPLAIQLLAPHGCEDVLFEAGKKVQAL